MKRLLHLACAAALCAGVLHAKQLKLDNGNVVMSVPDDFTALDPREIKSCFPTLNGALLAVGDSGRIMFVALDLTNAHLYSDQLRQIQASYPTALTDHIPGATVIADKIVSIDGTDWLRVEFTRPTHYGRRTGSSSSPRIMAGP
jgi:hypothetical protein